MDTVEIVTLIKTTLSRRGNGTESNPFRVLTEYWTLDGKKVFEIDPTKIIKNNEERKKQEMKEYTEVDYITCCPKCESRGITSPLMNTGKCSNKDCDYVYKSKESRK